MRDGKETRLRRGCQIKLKMSADNIKKKAKYIQVLSLQVGNRDPKNQLVCNNEFAYKKTNGDIEVYVQTK